MKLTYYAVWAMMCFNAAAMILVNMDIVGVPIEAWNPDQLDDAYNASEIVGSWNPEEKSFFDIGAGLLFLWNENLPVLESFTEMLQVYGCPSIIVDPLKGIWRSILTGLVISFLSGRDFMP